MRKIARAGTFTRQRPIAFALAFIVIGFTTIYLAKAAVSPNAKLSEGEAYNSSQNISTISDVSSSNGAYIQFDTQSSTTVPLQCMNGGTYLWSNLEICGWLSPSSTGVPSSTTLSNYTGPTTITANGTIIDGKQINGNLTIDADNVTIKNSLINYSGSGGGGSGAVKILANATAIIDHVEINGNSAVHACVWHEGSSAVITYLKCHDVEDGVFSWFQNAGSPISGNNLTMENSYIYRLNAVESNGHWDGYQTEGAQHVVLRHNVFDMNQNANAAIAFWNDQQTTDDVLVENNLIRGGGFSVYAEDYSPSEPTNSSPNNAVGGNAMTNVRFLNNKFSDVDSGCVGSFGVWFFRSAWNYQGGPTGGWGANGNLRSGNTVLETGASVDNSNPSVNGVVCS